jgi:hypothetical protein
MNRRKAISRIAITGLGAAVTGATYKWWTFARTPDLDYLRQNTALLGALSETIIPAGDTPGANEARVAQFIVRMVSDCTPRKEQNTFISGLQDVQAHCRHAFGNPYEACNPSDQTAALAHFEEKGRPYHGLAGKIESRLTGRSFFTILKDYTVYGYCTSEPGATRGLAYLYIPGSYNGCTSLQPGQKSWATS